MGRVVSIPLLIVLPLTALAEEKKSPPPDRYLPDWIEGKVEIGFWSHFQTLDPRAGTDVEGGIQAAIRCHFLRERIGEEKVRAVAARLVRRLADRELPEAKRVRILYILGRLRVKESVPALAAAGDAGIEPLGFYGAVRREETFELVGHRYWYVVSAAAPSEAATKALVAVLERVRNERSGIEPVLEALGTHRDDEIVRVAVECLTGRYRGIRARHRKALKDLVRMNAGVASIERYSKLLGHEKNRLRALAADALGWSARREAVAPLLKALKDDDPDVCKAARASLHRLSGSKEKWPDFEKLLGKKGEKLDLSKAKHWPVEEKKPGVYKLGR